MLPSTSDNSIWEPRVRLETPLLVCKPGFVAACAGGPPGDAYPKPDAVGRFVRAGARLSCFAHEYGHALGSKHLD